MSFSYSHKDLVQLERLLEKKLLDLKVAEQGVETPPGDKASDLELTQNILKFVMFLVNRELVGVFSGRVEKEEGALLVGPAYYFGLDGAGNNKGAPTICENCRAKNPTQTHCVHRC